MRKVKSAPVLTPLPVVVLTTSKPEEDVLRTYEAHANCYITKPVDLEQFIKVVRSIERFWLSIVELPANDLASGGRSGRRSGPRTA